MKLDENVYEHNTATKFDNQPYRTTHFRLMALSFYKNVDLNNCCLQMNLSVLYASIICFKH